MPTVAGEMVASFGSKVNPFSKGDSRLRGLFSHFNLLFNLPPTPQFQGGFEADYSERYK